MIRKFKESANGRFSIEWELGDLDLRKTFILLSSPIETSAVYYRNEKLFCFLILRDEKIEKLRCRAENMQTAIKFLNYHTEQIK